VEPTLATLRAEVAWFAEPADELLRAELVVEGGTAEVLGDGGVSFHDATRPEMAPLVPEEGGRYDLGSRAAIE